MMYGAGPVMQSGPYDGWAMEDVLIQDPLAVIEYMEATGYYDPELKRRAEEALNSDAVEEEDFDSWTLGDDS